MLTVMKCRRSRNNKSPSNKQQDCALHADERKANFYPHNFKQIIEFGSKYKVCYLKKPMWNLHKATFINQAKPICFISI